MSVQPCARGQEGAVDALYLLAYGGVLRGLVAVGLDIHHITDVGDDTIADGIVRAQEAVGVGHLGEVFVDVHAVVHHGTYLQQVELAGLVGVEVHGKLYLHRALHLALTVLEHLAHEFGKWEHPVLEHAREGEYLAVAPLIEAIVDALVIGVVGGAYPLQGAMPLGIPQRDAHQIEPVIDLHGGRVGVAVGPHSQEICLRVAQGRLRLTRLQHLVRMCRAHTKAHAPIHDVLAQPHGQGHGALLGLLVAYGVIVDAARHTADDGVEDFAMRLAHNLLQDDSHLLLVDDVAGCGHIVLAGPVIDAGIHAAYGLREHGQPLVLVLGAGNHVSAVDTGEGLVMRVLEQTAAAHGYGASDHLQEGLQVAQQAHGEARAQEMGQHLLVGDVAQCHLVEVIGIHELVEDVGTEHHGLGYSHGHALHLVEVGVTLEQVVDEGQAASLAAQTAITDAGKVGILVETLALEHGHHALVLHPAVGHDSVQDNLSVCVHVLQALPGDALEKLRDGEEGTAGQPAAHVVVCYVVEQAARGHGHDVVLQVLEIMDAGNLLHGVGVAEHEIAKAEILEDEGTQVHVHLLGVLVDEVGMALRCQRLLVALGRLHYQGDVGVVLADGAQKSVSRLVILVPAGKERETAVTDDPQRVVGKAVVERPCLLVVAREHYLGTSTHAQSLERGVECLGGKLQALLQHEAVQVGQDAAIEAYVVLDQEYHLHARAAYVMLQVHAVLHELDDAQEQFGVSQPAEHVLKGREILVLHPAGDSVAEGCEHHDGHTGIVVLDGARDVEDTVVLGGGHADDQVYLLGGHVGLGGMLARHLYEAGREAEPQPGILGEYLLVHAPVVLEDEGIIGVGYDEDVADALEHQVNKGCVLECHVGCVFGSMGRQGRTTPVARPCIIVGLPPRGEKPACHTMPCAIMALATFMKPATLAPFT